MKIKIPTDFDFAHRGIEIRNYRAGEEVETDDDELVDFVRSLRKKTPREFASTAADSGTSVAPESETNAADLAG